METRVCKICKKELPLNYFREHSQSKDGYLHTCKDCQKIRKLQRNEIKLELEEQENYSRICPVCNKLLDISHFSLDRRSNDGRRWLCKECEVLHNSINQGKDKNYFKKLRLQVDSNYREIINSQKRKSCYNNHESVLLRHAKQRALKNNLEFNLELSDIVIPEICPILEVPFIMGTKGDYMYTPSIDRIDNSKGYVKGNIQIISMKANTMKNSATPEELKKFCKNVLRYSLNNYENN